MKEATRNDQTDREKSYKRFFIHMHIVKVVILILQTDALLT